MRLRMIYVCVRMYAHDMRACYAHDADVYMRMYTNDMGMHTPLHARLYIYNVHVCIHAMHVCTNDIYVHVCMRVHTYRSIETTYRSMSVMYACVDPWMVTFCA